MKNISKWEKGFAAGFASACAIMLRNSRENSIIEDVYECNFMDEEALIQNGVDQFDVDTLKPIISELKRKRNPTL